MLYELNLNDVNKIKEIKAFLKHNNYANYMQSIEWNLIRNEKQKYYLYYELNHKIIWVCNLLEKEKNNEKYVYAPRGPVLDYQNKEILNLFFHEIKKWLVNNNYKYIVINPEISEDVFQNVNDLNYVITNKNEGHDSNLLAIMPIIFDEEELIKKLPSKFRQNTRRSYRKNLKFKLSKKVDIDNFYKLYLDTAQRHDFNPHTKAYFQNLIKVYQDDLIFLEVWYEDIPLAMSIDIVYKDRLIYLYGVSNSRNRNLLGMYYLQWEAIKYCILNKIPNYDFGGVFCSENDIDNKDYGLYQFKKGYCYQGFKDILPDVIVRSNYD